MGDKSERKEKHEENQKVCCKFLLKRAGRGKGNTTQRPNIGNLKVPMRTEPRVKASPRPKILVLNKLEEGTRV